MASSSMLACPNMQQAVIGVSNISSRHTKIDVVSTILSIQLNSCRAMPSMCAHADICHTCQRPGPVTCSLFLVTQFAPVELQVVCKTFQAWSLAKAVLQVDGRGCMGKHERVPVPDFMNMCITPAAQPCVQHS